MNSRPYNVLLCDQLQFRIILFVYYLVYLPCLPSSEQKTVALNPVCNLEIGGCFVASINTGMKITKNLTVFLLVGH
jgi:hypothetical protein